MHCFFRSLLLTRLTSLFFSFVANIGKKRPRKNGVSGKSVNAEKGKRRRSGRLRRPLSRKRSKMSPWKRMTVKGRNNISSRSRKKLRRRRKSLNPSRRKVMTNNLW